MGTPGIGKTFLIDSLLNQPHSDNRFISRKDALIKIARQNVHEYAWVYRTFIQIGLKLPLRDAPLLLANIVNRKKEEEIFSNLSSIDQIIDQALVQYREFSQPALRKIKRVQGLYQQIIDGVLISLNPRPEAVLMDESLAQHLPDVHFESINTKELFPHLLIHVTGDVDNLIAHIRNREKRKNKSPRTLNTDFLQQSLDYYSDRAQKFSKAGVSVVTIDIGDQLSNNIEKILSSVNMLYSSKIKA